jgi:hypothetical protein
MKLGTRTTQILKNFVQINPSLAFKEGNILATISPAKSVIAKATISENITDGFCVYDLSKFISTLSLFNEPELIINGNNATIKEGTRKVIYGFADESLIVTPPNKELKLPTVEATFNVSNDTFQSALKALSILGLTDVAFIGDGEKVVISALDNKGAISDTYSAEVGETSETFKTVFKAENLKFLPDDYEVSLYGKAAKFVSGDVEYIVATES